ncbi:hypothetical protein LCGC14_2509130, partial [marine sediment metagenome]
MAEKARSPWGADGLPDGQPKTTYYDPFGRSRVLPADPYSLDHYLSQGLTLEPPENPISIERLGDFARRDKAHGAPMSATRQVAPSEAPAEQPNVEMLLARMDEMQHTIVSL